MRHRLPNYVRTYRKRTGLTQDEIAFLLGCRDGSRVSKYESFVRNPNLETALAYKAVFRAPVCELFAGLDQKVEAAVHNRAELLLGQLSSSSRLLTDRKLAALRSITAATARRLGAAERRSR